MVCIAFSGYQRRALTENIVKITGTGLKIFICHLNVSNNVLRFVVIAMTLQYSVKNQ